MLNQLNTSKSAAQPKTSRSTSFDVMTKMIIIGDSGVGKTNILTRFCHNIFKQSHVATIGVDFNVKIMQIQGVKIKMQVWDTAGQQRFKTITQTYYKGASGIIIVYSVDCRQSFDNIRKWVQQVNQKVPSSIPKILVANKIDLFEQNQGGFDQYEIPYTIHEEKTTQEDDIPQTDFDAFKKHEGYFSHQNSHESCREVSRQQGQNLAKQLHMSYIEVSAKYNTQIYDIFYKIGKQIISKSEYSQEQDTRYYRKVLVGSKIDPQTGLVRVKISEHNRRDSCLC